jgi:hypothetical protein
MHALVDSSRNVFSFNFSRASISPFFLASTNCFIFSFYVYDSALNFANNEGKEVDEGIRVVTGRRGR